MGTSTKEMRMEQTLVLLKPDCLKRRLTGEVIKELLKWRHGKLEIVALKSVNLTKGKAESLYHDHRDKDFFDKLINHMISGPVVVMLIEGNKAISECRDFCFFMRQKWKDEDKPKRENLIHAPDSGDAANRELKLFFP